jgi:formaldehyde-activating enzyme involved in methanogenesis
MTARVHQNNIRLQALMEVMSNKENPIDVMHFHSSIKTGAFDLIDVNFDHSKLRTAIDNAFTDGRYNERTGNLTLNIELKNGKTVPIELKGVKRSDSDTDLFGAYRKAVAKLQSENTHAEINGQQAQENYLSNEEIEDLYNKFEFDSKEAVVEYINSILAQNGKTDSNGVLRKFIHETPYSDYRIMQPSSDHLMDTDALIGTQLINVLPADLVETTTVSLYNSEDISGQDINKLYQMVLAEMDLAMYKEIQKTFGSIENLQQMLYNKMRKNSQYGPELYKSLEIVERDGVKQFRDPLNSPLIANKVQPLLFGVFKDLVQRKRIKGGNVVLVSDYGLRDNLKIEYIRDNDGEITGVKYMEAYISAPSENFIKDFTTYDENTKSYHIDLEKMKQSMTEEEIEDVLTMIGYRVPTENKFSIAQIKIKGFLPANMGTAIILPSDIVEMSGTDFDEMSTLK